MPSIGAAPGSRVDGSREAPLAQQAQQPLAFRAARYAFLGARGAVGADRLNAHIPQRSVAVIGPSPAAAADVDHRVVRRWVRGLPSMLIERGSLIASTGARLDRPAPRPAAWLPAAVDPDDASYDQLMRSIVGDFPVRGYRQVFEQAGFGAAIALAEKGAEPDDIVTALPADAARAVGPVGDLDTVRPGRPSTPPRGSTRSRSSPQPAGERTLNALAPAAD